MNSFVKYKRDIEVALKEVFEKAIDQEKGWVEKYSKRLEELPEEKEATFGDRLLYAFFPSLAYPTGLPTRSNTEQDLKEHQRKLYDLERLYVQCKGKLNTVKTPSDEDQIKMENKIERERKIDEYYTKLEASKRVRAKESLIRWRKVEREQITNDTSLSSDEQSILLLEIDCSFNEKMKGLDQSYDISITEDE